MEIELITSQNQAERATKNEVAATSSLYDPSNRALYMRKKRKIILKLNCYKRELNLGWGPFVTEFVETLAHETTHDCITQEVAKNKKLGKWYKNNEIGANLGEERITYLLTSRISKEEITERLLQNSTYKSMMYHAEYLSYRIRYQTYKRLYYMVTLWLIAFLLINIIMAWLR